MRGRRTRDRGIAPLVVVALLGLFLLLGMVLFMGAVMVLGMVGTRTDHMGVMPFLGLGGSFLWLVVLVVALVLLFRALQDEDQEEPDAALEELRQAYARGDLTDDEYDRRRERLQDDG